MSKSARAFELRFVVPRPACLTYTAANRPEVTVGSVRRYRGRRGHVRPFGAAALALMIVVTLAGCTSDGPAGTPSDTTKPATGEPMQLNVLVYNIEYSGGPATDKVIQSLDADVVGVLESYNRLPEIAKETGYPYYNVGLQLLSKYPIHEPSGANGLYAFIEVQPGYVVAFFNTHLDYVKYGPKLLVDGVPLNQVIQSENEVRTSSLQIQIPDMESLAAEDYPVFLTGDFNEPSSLDYSAETVGTRPGITEPVPWPVSEALFDIGFRDTYREIFPDPVGHPGLTKDNPDFRAGGSGDRIDYVYAGGPSTTTNSQLVGEPGGADVDIAFSPWTSDHRAVFSTFDVTPVALPTTVSLDRRMLTVGDTLTVLYNDGTSADGSIAVIPEGAGASDASAVVTEPAPGSSGELPVDTSDMAPAGYEILLLDDAGAEIARNAFWVRSGEATVSLQTSKPSYAVGEPVEVTWDSGPANRWDWLGVYRASAPNPKKDDYLLWGYTGLHDSGALPPSVSGSMVFSDGSQGKPWPLPPGRYVVHYLLTDQYVSAGSVMFRVTP
jgi:endonuclease/exonuclease/phosphatase family metal-dependent hydrolase